VSVAIDLERRAMESSSGRRRGDKKLSQEESGRTPAKAEEVPRAAPTAVSNEGPNARTLKRRLRYKRALEKAKQATPVRSEPTPRVRINAAKASLLEMKVDKVRSKRRVERVAEIVEVDTAERPSRWADHVYDFRGICIRCGVITDTDESRYSCTIAPPPPATQAAPATPVAKPARVNVAGPSKKTAPSQAVPIWDPRHPQHDPSKVKKAPVGVTRSRRTPAPRNTKIDKKTGLAVHKNTPS